MITVCVTPFVTGTDIIFVIGLASSFSVSSYGKLAVLVVVLSM
jgi:hypothetical protein